MIAATCPACRRPIAVARPTCLYCGAALPAEAVAAVERAGTTEAPAPSLPAVASRFGLRFDPRPAPTADRLLLVVDLSRTLA